MALAKSLSSVIEAVGDDLRAKKFDEANAGTVTWRRRPVRGKVIVAPRRLLGLFGAYDLNRAVVIAMIAMRMMQVTADQIVGVIAVG